MGPYHCVCFDHCQMCLLSWLLAGCGTANRPRRGGHLSRQVVASHHQRRVRVQDFHTEHHCSTLSAQHPPLSSCVCITAVCLSHHIIKTHARGSHNTQMRGTRIRTAWCATSQQSEVASPCRAAKWRAVLPRVPAAARCPMRAACSLVRGDAARCDVDNNNTHSFLCGFTYYWQAAELCRHVTPTLHLAKRGHQASKHGLDEGYCAVSSGVS